jgi:hypothetical protein
MFGLFFLFGAVAAWTPWYSYLWRAFAPMAERGARPMLAMVPPLLFVGFAAFLFRFAAANVSKDPEYFLAYLGVYAVTAVGSARLLDVVGIQPLKDPLERGNGASLLPAMAALLGATALNVGANIGEGASELSTLFPLFVGGLVWTGFALALASATPLAESTAVGRDKLAGAAFGLTWFAASVPLARAAAGDWVSFSATSTDLLGAVPFLVVLLVAAMLLSRGARFTWVRLGGLVTICVGVVALTAALPLASRW